MPAADHHLDLRPQQQRDLRRRPLGDTTWTEYNGSNLPIAVTDALGAYDGDPAHTTTTTYTEMGEVYTVTDPPPAQTATRGRPSTFTTISAARPKRSIRARQTARTMRTVPSPIMVTMPSETYSTRPIPAAMNMPGAPVPPTRRTPHGIFTTGSIGRPASSTPRPTRITWVASTRHPRRSRPTAR